MNAPGFATFLAPAKINLSLRVFGRRPDGYHEIRTVMVPLSLHDTVTVEETEGGIAVETGDPDLPGDRSNTCFRAAEAFRERTGRPAGVRIILAKRIPRDAGLGGGSSDAAAVFKGLSAVTGIDLSREEWIGAAASVGADVPFFLGGRPALAEGIGERLAPVEWRLPFFAVIVKPPFGLSTREGYERLRREPGGPPDPADPPAFRSWEDVAAWAGNDFEEAWERERPGVAGIREEIRATGARACGMTGSGSAWFGLYDDEGQARRARGALSGRGDGRSVFLARHIA